MWILIHAANIYVYLIPELKDPYSSEYLMQAIWWGLFIVSHNLLTLSILISAIVAYCKPRVLLDHMWQTKLHNLYTFLLFANLFIFIGVPLVELFRFGLLLFDFKYRETQENARTNDHE